MSLTPQICRTQPKPRTKVRNPKISIGRDDVQRITKKGNQSGAQAMNRMKAVGKIRGGAQSIEPMTSDEWEFANAMHQYSEITHHRFPTWSEALHVLVGLGYHK